MATTPSLPQTRPTSDTYGPDLVNERPVSRPDYELDANAWNQAKADIAAACQVVPLAIVRVSNNGTSTTVVRQRPSSLGAVSVARAGAGHVTVTMPANVVPLDAMVTAAGTGALVASGSNTYRTAVYVNGNAIDVYTVSDAGAVDVDFTLVVY